MKILKKIHTFYAGLIFLSIFLLLFPFYIMLLLKNSWRNKAYFLNRIWAKLFFILIFKRVIVEIHESVKSKPVCIFCPNHFSYLDIPIMGFSPKQFKFIGKSAIKKVPLFGYMFSKFHVSVNRRSKLNSYETYKKCKQIVKEGTSLVIFPEGGINSQEPPQMSRFKDGAFRIAIEQQIPIIPVTIPYNWIILPDKHHLEINRGQIKVIFHAPVETENLTLNDLNELRLKVYSIINKELKQYN